MNLLSIHRGSDGGTLDVNGHSKLGTVRHRNKGGLDLRPAGVVETENAVADLPHAGRGLTGLNAEHESRHGLVDGDGQLDGVVTAEGSVGGEGARIAGDGQLAVFAHPARGGGDRGVGCVFIGFSHDWHSNQRDYDHNSA